MNYIISTERLGLRMWRKYDIEPFIKMNEDEKVMKFFPKTLTGSETLESFNSINVHFDRYGFGLFVVEHKLTKQFIGFTGFTIPNFDSFFTPCVEIGWRYRKEFWRRGFATEAAIACLQYGFHVLKFDRVVSFTSSINTDSQKVMKRICMRYIGEFDHPKVERNNILCRHVLYETTRENA